MLVSEDMLGDLIVESVVQNQNANGSFGAGWGTDIAALDALAAPDLVLSNLVSSSGSLVNQAPANFLMTIKNRGYRTVTDGVVYHFADDVLLPIEYNLAASGDTLEPQAEMTVATHFGNTIHFVEDTEFQLYVETDHELGYENNWFDETYFFAGAADGSPGFPVYYIAQKYDIDNAPALNIRWSKKDDPLRKNYITGIRLAGETQWGYYGISDDWNGAFLSPLLRRQRVFSRLTFWRL